MNALAIMIAAATVGVDYGWHRVTDGEWEYIIQIEPALLDTLVKGQALVSQMPPELRGVRRFRIQIGEGQVPRDAVPVQGILAAEAQQRGGTVGLPAAGTPSWSSRGPPDSSTAPSHGYEWLNSNPIRLDPLENSFLNGVSGPNVDPRSGRGFPRPSTDAWTQNSSLSGTRNDQGWSQFGTPPSWSTATRGANDRGWSRLDEAPDRAGQRPRSPWDLTSDSKQSSPWGTSSPNFRDAWNDPAGGRFGSNGDPRGTDLPGPDERRAASGGLSQWDRNGNWSDDRLRRTNGQGRLDPHDAPDDDRFETRDLRDSRDHVASRDRQDTSHDRAGTSRTRVNDQHGFKPNTSHNSRTIPTNTVNSPQQGRVAIDQKAVWPMTTTIVLLFASLGGNLYLGWLAVDFYRRYREAAWELRTSGPHNV